MNFKDYKEQYYYQPSTIVKGQSIFKKTNLAGITTGGAKVQVTGHRSGHRSSYRSQVRPQATGQVTGQITGHTKTIGHWKKLFLIDILLYKVKQAKEPQLYFFCSELYQIPHMRKYIHVYHARRTCVTA